MRGVSYETCRDDGAVECHSEEGGTGQNRTWLAGAVVQWCSGAAVRRCVRAAGAETFGLILCFRGAKRAGKHRPRGAALGGARWGCIGKNTCKVKQGQPALHLTRVATRWPSGRPTAH
ncbi:hypothetical protein E2C01_078738 [Portunus trituberculatus]|uniref:Uncharacterized protein n=1 Tax=Portunus trituberculatus TaxID=210409 RepID=A0A5B7IUX2_PORTR|nr:hypothetical protein [Portunus trituberculatus]